MLFVRNSHKMGKLCPKMWHFAVFGSCALKKSSIEIQHLLCGAPNLACTSHTPKYICIWEADSKKRAPVPQALAFQA